jgi:hypothetical protein
MHNLRAPEGRLRVAQDAVLGGIGRTLSSPEGTAENYPGRQSWAPTFVAAIKKSQPSEAQDDVLVGALTKTIPSRLTLLLGAQLFRLIHVALLDKQA